MCQAMGGSHQEVAGTTGGVTDPEIQETLKKAILKQDGKFINANVTGFTKSKGKVTAVKSGSSEYQADAIILSAGSGSTALATDLGHSIPMIPAWGASNKSYS